MSEGIDEASNSEPPRRVQGVTLAVGLLVVLMALFLSVGVMVQTLHVGFGLWFTEVFIFLAIPWVFLELSGREPSRYVGSLAPGWKLPAYGFALGTVNFLGGVLPLQYLSQLVAPPWLRDMFDASVLFKNQTPVELALIISGVGLAAPSCEEIFFRGVFQNSLLRAWQRPAVAIAVTSALFSAFHLDPVGFLARFELGVLFGVLFWKTGSVWPGVFAHAANNLVSTLIFFVSERSGATEAEPSPAAVLALSAVGLTLLYVMASLPRFAPALLQAKTVAEDVPPKASRRSLLRLAAPWAGGALLSLLALAAIDARGVQLNVWDTRVRVKTIQPGGHPRALARQAELQALRRKARRGEVPIETYVDERKAWAEEQSLMTP